MSPYKKILLAVDLHPDFNKNILEKAAELSEKYQAELNILHVVEHITAYGIAQAYPTVVNLEREIADEAEKELKNLVQTHKLQVSNIRVEIGSPKISIIDIAKEINANLIILGSHGRHGLGLLLGSTANAVLHHAPCDVLAVRLQENRA